LAASKNIVPIPGAKICRGNEGQKSRYRDKQKCKKSRHCRGKNRENRGNVAAKIVKIAALSRQNCRISVMLLAQCEISNYEQAKPPFYQSQKQIKTSKTVQE
jgi:hypothetical protein